MICPGNLRLTARERELVKHLFRGLSDAEIAQEMRTGTQPIKNLMVRIIRKLLIDTQRFHGRLMVALILHRHRWEFGIPCEACGESD